MDILILRHATLSLWIVYPHWHTGLIPRIIGRCFSRIDAIRSWIWEMIVYRPHPKLAMVVVISFMELLVLATGRHATSRMEGNAAVAGI